MIRRPPRSTQSRSSAASDVYKRQIISFGMNGTYEEASEMNNISLRTGVEDIKTFRDLLAVNGQQEARRWFKRFNGNETELASENPWREPIPIKGKDSFVAIPGQVPSKINIFLGKIGRNFTLEWSGETKSYAGVETRRYRLSKNDLASSKSYPPNHVYYLDKWDGVFNATPITKLPICVSKSNFLDADEELSSGIEVYDGSKPDRKITQNREDDDSAIDLEPNSGSPIRFRASIQGNVYIEPDFLFPVSRSMLLPIFQIEAQGGLSDRQISELFAPLKNARLAQKIIWWFGVIVFNLSIIIGIILIMLRRKQLRSSVKKDKLLFLLEPQEDTQATL
eukprot:TRINITY_DN2770_c0_g2_i2.p1 TRINITY_DN2770_c0_g2~~TRINITY_DN2770_c0_g2_i2.p1  ORF type:complete len:337 (+),score=78.63 TRINITY_DN2770_c0_g2_i2:44-1054(+)